MARLSDTSKILMLMLAFAVVAALLVLLAISALDAKATDLCATHVPWFDEPENVREACTTWHALEDHCGCGETLMWDPVPEAAYYEIQRTGPSGTVSVVGRQAARKCIDWNLETEECLLWRETPWWLPAWDCEAKPPHTSGCVFPRLLTGTQVYTYRVRAVDASGVPSVNWSLPTTHARGPWFVCGPNVVGPYGNGRCAIL